GSSASSEGRETLAYAGAKQKSAARLRDDRGSSFATARDATDHALAFLRNEHSRLTVVGEHGTREPQPAAATRSGAKVPTRCAPLCRRRAQPASWDRGPSPG